MIHRMHAPQYGIFALGTAAHAYLELAVLVRALQGLADSGRLASVPDRSSLWAGLFDLRENLLDGAVDDLRALAA